MSGNSFESVLSIVGAIVPLFSALASFLNHVVRVQVNEGKEPNAGLVAFGSLMNVGAVNIDKSIQLAKLATSLMKKPEEEPKAE